MDLSWWPKVSRTVNTVVYLVVPLLGLFFWGWDWRPIVVLFWLENITIGLTTAITLYRRQRGNVDGPKPAMPWTFFLVHFGIFTVVHGVFVFAIIEMAPEMLGTADTPFSPIWSVIPWIAATATQVFGAARSNPPLSGGIGRAYARVFVLHATVLLAVWILLAWKLPAIVAAVLIVLHAAVDAVFALVDRRQAAKRASAATASA